MACTDTSTLPEAGAWRSSRVLGLPATSFSTALSKSLSNRRSWTTRYFSNSFSAWAWATFAEILTCPHPLFSVLPRTVDSAHAADGVAPHLLHHVRRPALLV